MRDHRRIVGRNQEGPHHRHVLHAGRSAVAGKHRCHRRQRRVVAAVEHQPVDVSVRPDHQRRRKGRQRRSRHHPVIGTALGRVRVGVPRLVRRPRRSDHHPRRKGSEARLDARIATVGVEVATDHQVVRRLHLPRDKAVQRHRLIVAPRLVGAPARCLEMHAYRQQVFVPGQVDPRPDKLPVADLGVVPHVRFKDRIAGDDAIRDVLPRLHEISVSRTEIRADPTVVVGHRVAPDVHLLDQRDVRIQAVENPAPLASVVRLVGPARNVRRHDADHLVRRRHSAAQPPKDRGGE